MEYWQGTGIVGCREVYRPPPPVMHDYKDVKEFEVGGGHGEEVHRPGDVDMVVKKCQPGEVILFVTRCCSKRMELFGGTPAGWSDPTFHQERERKVKYTRVKYIFDK